jgi:hypothetical protein
MNILHEQYGMSKDGDIFFLDTSLEQDYDVLDVPFFVAQAYDHHGSINQSPPQQCHNSMRFCQ